MVLKTDFQTTAFGGFKKEEVTEYIKSIGREYEDEIAILDDELEHTKAQLAEFKVLVEDQYAKIVDVTEQADNASQALNQLQAQAQAREQDEENEYVSEVKRLNNQLSDMSAELQHTDAQKRQLLEDNSKLDENLRTFKSQIPLYLAEVNNLKEQLKTFANVQTENESYITQISELKQKLANYLNAPPPVAQIVQADDCERYIDQINGLNGQIITLNEQIITLNEQIKELKHQLEVYSSEDENIQAQSEEIVISAKEEAHQILINARNQIETTISLSEENQERAKKLYEVAAKEADEILKRAQQKAESEKGQYESCLRALERQKAKLIEALDCIKQEVSTIKIGQERRERPQAIQSTQAPQSFRGKYTSADKERFNGKPKY